VSGARPSLWEEPAIPTLNSPCDATWSFLPDGAVRLPDLVEAGVCWMKSVPLQCLLSARSGHSLARPVAPVSQELSSRNRIPQGGRQLT